MSQINSLPTADQSSLALTQAAVVDAITEEMKLAPPITGWVAAAQDQLIATTDELTRKVGVSAVEIARKRGATVVDAQDVRNARSALASATWSGWLLTVAGILGGAAISAVITIRAAASPPPGEIYWNIGIAIVAVITITLLAIARPRGKKRT